jgi:hypothetical protein
MRFSRRYSRAAIAGLVIYAIGLTGAAAFFIFYQFTRTAVEEVRLTTADAVGQDRRYTGTVLIPDNFGVRCRRFDFDNVTGAIREAPRSGCENDASSGNSTQGRIGAIRDYFAKH